MMNGQAMRRFPLVMLVAAIAALSLPRMLALPRSIALEAAAIEAVGGKAYSHTLRLPLWLKADHDVPGKPPRSRAVLDEDGTPLPLPHANPRDVERFASGQMAHLATRVVFSASDGSDPRVNGRSYRLVIPVEPAPWLYLPFALCVLALLGRLLRDDGLRPVRAPMVGPWRRLGLTVAVTGGCFATVALLHYTPPMTTPWLAGDQASAKLAAIGQASVPRRVVLVGDSFTAYGVQPSRLGRCLGIPVVNSAVIGNWFPGQHAYNGALASALEPGTLVVWSVDEILLSSDETYPRYPVGPLEVLRYAWAGYPLGQLAKEIGAHWPVAQFIAAAAGIRDSVLAISLVQLPGGVWPAEPRKAAPERWVAARGAYLSASARQGLEDKTEAILADLAGDADVVGADILRDDLGLPHSVDARDRHGGRRRVEVIPAYHRAVQAQERHDTPARILPRHLWAFEEGLARFRAAGARVVVNTLELSPSHYGDGDRRLAWRSLMADAVGRAATTAGTAMIRVPSEDLGDDRFFDYGHLNQTGADLYSERLCRAVAPHLGGAAHAL